MGVRVECNYNFGGGTIGGRLGLARLNEELLKEDMPPNEKLHNLSYPALVYLYKPVMTTITLSLLQRLSPLFCPSGTGAR